MKYAVALAICAILVAAIVATFFVEPEDYKPKPPKERRLPSVSVPSIGNSSDEANPSGQQTKDPESTPAPKETELEPISTLPTAPEPIQQYVATIKFEFDPKSPATKPAIFAEKLNVEPSTLKDSKSLVLLKATENTTPYLFDVAGHSKPLACNIRETSAPICFVYDPQTQTSFAFYSGRSDSPQTFCLTDARVHGFPVLQDVASGSYWELSLGYCFSGPRKGEWLEWCAVQSSHWDQVSTQFGNNKITAVQFPVDDSDTEDLSSEPIDYDAYVVRCGYNAVIIQRDELNENESKEFEIDGKKARFQLGESNAVTIDVVDDGNDPEDANRKDRLFVRGVIGDDDPVIGLASAEFASDSTEKNSH
ncbi:MAG: hypothetical protein R3C03_09845 [Pirellulaceae bacterium]